MRSYRLFVAALTVALAMALLGHRSLDVRLQSVPSVLQAAEFPQTPPAPPAGGRGANPLPGLAALVESPTTGPDAPRFEVASVKRNKAGRDGASFGQTLPSGQVRMTNMSLLAMIRSAYGLRQTDQVVGGPSWIDSDGFDVDARPASPTNMEQTRFMFRTLLADRFKLVVVKESREQPVYALVLARRDGALGPEVKRPAGACVMVIPGFVAAAAGLNDKPADPAKPFVWPSPGQPGRRCGIGPDGDALKAGSATMATLITLLTPMLDRPVVDKTGLTGEFDFDLRFDRAGTGFARGRGASAVAPTAPSEPGAGPSIFTALQEQLGLRLDAQRGPVEVLAVQSAELPTGN